MNFKKLLNVLYPKNFSCYGCGCDVFDETGFCKNCTHLLKYITGNVCQHCSEPIPNGSSYCLKCKGKDFICSKIVSVFEYTGLVKSCIYKLKYTNCKYIADVFGKYLYDCVVKNNLKFDVVTVVPLCESRFKERKYNQAELLAMEFNKFANKPLILKNLIRKKETPTQTNLSKIDREVNMIDAFKVNNNKEFKNKDVLLIDDVYTTGATLTACSKELMKAGAKSVVAVTLAHTTLANRKDEDE